MTKIAFGEILSHSFAEWLRGYIADNNLSQAQMAARLGLAPATVQHIISGRRKASSILVQRSFEILGLDADTVLAPYLNQNNPDSARPDAEPGPADGAAEDAFGPKAPSPAEAPPLPGPIDTKYGNKFGRALMKMSLAELTTLYPDLKPKLDAFLANAELDRAIENAPEYVAKYHSRMIKSYESEDYAAALAFLYTLFSILERLDRQKDRQARQKIKDRLNQYLVSNVRLSKNMMESLIRDLHMFMTIVFPDPILKRLRDNH